MADAIIENRLQELQKQLNQFQKLLVTNQKAYDDALSKKELLISEIAKIKDNISYIKKKAKIVTISRIQKAKSQLQIKEGELVKVNEALVTVNKTKAWLKEKVNRR